MKTSLVIKGVNFSNLLEEFKKQNIKIFNIKRISACEIEISFTNKQKSKIIAILNQKCYTISSQKKSQLPFYLKPFKNTAIIVGIIFGFLLNIMASFFVWNINLVGDASLSSDITKTLNENGIKRFALKSQISAQTIKKILYENVDAISLVSVSQRGTTLFINYTKRVNAQTDFSESENIIAKSDGMIASILTLSGTPLVSPGDYVRKGQILIAGTTAEGEKVKARGQVFAYVWKSATAEFPLTTILWARTNNTCTNFKVTFKDSTLFQSHNTHSFKKFETEENISYLTDKVLPIKIVETIEYELEPIETEQDFEQNKQKVIAEAKMRCWEQIAGDENILEEKTETNFVSNIYFVTHYIKIKEQISWN